MIYQLRTITQLLKLPVICILCGHTSREPHAVCNACKQLLTPLQQACFQCALPMANALVSSTEHSMAVCGHCCKKKPSVDRVFCVYQFEELLREAIHQFKYHQGLYLTTFLTDLILEALSEDAYQTQCLIPVPIHRKKLKQRGFNQAAELTKQIAKQLKIPYQLNLCKKIIDTPSQAGLNAKHRLTNLTQAFSSKPTKLKHVTLIDDLITTGNTANELAYLLKQQGVKRVDLWCCARATF